VMTALPLTTRCPPISDIIHELNDTYSDHSMGAGSGLGPASDEVDAEGHFLEHEGRCEAGRSFFPDEDHERQSRVLRPAQSQQRQASCIIHVHGIFQVCRITVPHL
jgi:hypothetical protein